MGSKRLLICLIIFIFSLQHASAYSATKGDLKLKAVIVENEVMGTFKLPTALFYDEGNKRLYVADSGNNRLISFDESFDYLAEQSVGAIQIPVGLVKDNQGRFFIINAKENKVMILDTSNKSVEPLKLTNFPKGDMDLIPGSIAIDKDDRLYITDKLKKRIVVLDVSGMFLHAIKVKGDHEEDIFGFADVKVDSEYNVYAIDTVGRRVYVFNNTGELISSFGGSQVFDFPVSIAVDSKGLIYVVDRHKGSVLVFDKTGEKQFTISRLGFKEEELYYPAYIYIDKADRIYVVDSSKVQVYKEGSE